MEWSMLNLSVSFWLGPRRETAHRLGGVVWREMSFSSRAQFSSSAARTEFKMSAMRAIRSSGVDAMIVLIALRCRKALL